MQHSPKRVHHETGSETRVMRKALSDVEEERAIIIEYMKKRGWINPAEGTDECRASCFVVKQVTKRRWVVTFTGPNSVTEDDVYPAPFVEKSSGTSQRRRVLCNIGPPISIPSV